MTTVRLPDTLNYATVELASCLVTPSARAYGSKGAQTSAAAHATDNRRVSGDRTPYTGDYSENPVRLPTGHQRRPGPSDPMPQTCHSQRATTVNSDHPEIRCTAGRKRSQHGHPDSQAEYAGSIPVIGSRLDQRLMLFDLFDSEPGCHDVVTTRSKVAPAAFNASSCECV
jgi:hypothetical protein